jgi:hypothetical protein
LPYEFCFNCVTTPSFLILQPPLPLFSNSAHFTTVAVSGFDQIEKRMEMLLLAKKLLAGIVS